MSNHIHLALHSFPVSIDHMLMKASHKNKLLDMMSALFIVGWVISFRVFYLWHTVNTHQYMQLGKCVAVRVGEWGGFGVWVGVGDSFVGKCDLTIAMKAIMVPECCYEKCIAAIHIIYKHVLAVLRMFRKMWRDAPWLAKPLKMNYTRNIYAFRWFP